MPGWGTPVLIDSHSHIDMRQFNKDRDSVMERARRDGVAAVVDVGCDIPSSEAAIALAERYDEVFAVVGFHPHSAAAMGNGDIERLADLAQHPKVVAIGEIGLDFYRNLSPREAQVEAFNKQLDLARELDLPVVIHSRQATDEVFDILSRWAGKSSKPLGVLHCFSGDRELARKYIDMGFFISIAGPITYGKSSAADVARHLPLDKLLIETDCPFLTPQPHRGKRNEPSYVSLVAEKIGEIRGISGGEVARCTANNAIRLFRLPVQAEGEPCR
jgi:TatD DNase family protein